jgi:hypothetical protein
MQMLPTFGDLAPAELTLVERTLLRQANLRAAERCAVAERDLKSQLADLAAMTREKNVALCDLPPTLLVALRVSVEDFTSSARALYPSAEALLLAVKQTISEAVPHDDPSANDVVQTTVGWAIESYFAR